MKRKINSIILLVYLTVFIVIAIACNACSMFMYTDTSNYAKESPVYTKWKAEQMEILQKQINYAESKEFKQKYSGTSLGNDLPGTRANSVVGTNVDPLKDVRKSSLTPDYRDFNIRVTTGDSFNNSTMNYNVRVR